MTISALTLTIGGVVAELAAGTLDVDDRIAARSQCSFVVNDAAGTSLYSQGQPISITDPSDGSTVYAGFVQSSKAKRRSVLGGLSHSVQAVDNIYLADKRLAIKSYSAWLAGDMVSDMVASYLAAEGVIGQHISRIETTQADFTLVDASVGAGTLDTHLDVATNPGALQLAKQGANVSKVWTTQSDFTTGATFAGAATAVVGGDVELTLGTNQSITKTSQADWNAGTVGPLLSTTLSVGDLELGGYRRDWTDNLTTNQSVFGDVSPTQAASGGKYTLGAGASGHTHSEFTSAGTYTDCTIEVDVVMPAAGSSIGVLFGGTNWANANGTWAYLVALSTVAVSWQRGTNTGTTTQTITTISSVVATFTAGNTYRLKVVRSGSTCTISVAGTQYINTTDGTFTSAGNVGLRFFNSSGGTASGTFDNFGVLGTGSTESDTWVSPVLDISAAKSATTSSITWSATLPTGGTLTMEARLSTDGGSTYGAYTACTGGSPLPVISTATDLSNARLQIRATLATTDTAVTPVLSDFTISITAGYPVSGTNTWTSAAQSLSAAVANGGAILSWTATTPASTTLTMETSINGGSTWQSVSNGGAISGLAAGASLSGVSVLVRATLATTVAGSQPQLLDVTLSVTSAYYASGQRVSPGVSLAPLGTARSATVSWSATLNGGTLTVETSVDGGSTWTAITSGGTVAGINYQGSDYIDGFDTDTSGSYVTSGGGVYAWDTANSRIVATGGSNTAALYSLATYADVDVTCECDYADSAGLYGRSDNAGTQYGLFWRDDSGDTSWLSGQQMELWKRSGGTWTKIAGGAIAFVRGDRHRVRFSLSGTSLKAYFDDTLICSATDSSITASGYAGFDCGNGSTQVNRFYSLIAQSTGTSLSAKTLYLRQTLAVAASYGATPVLSDMTVTAKTSYIEDGPTVTNALFGYAKVSDCIDKLAEVADFAWNIGHDKHLRFRKRSALVAPRVIDGTVTVGSVLEDEDSVELENKNDAYRNVQYSTGATDITSLQTESYKGDGASQAFALRFPVARAPSSVTVGGVSKTVGVKGTDTGKDWYWSKGSETLAQDTAGTVLTSSDTLTVQYYGLFDTVGIAQDYGAVATMAALEGGGTTGYVEAAEAAPAGVDNATALSQYGGAKLTRYALAGKQLTFRTMVKGWRAGQLALVYVPWFQGLSGVQMLVESVKVQDVDGLHTWYSVAAILGPYDQSWASFWNALASKGSDGIDTVSVGSSGTLLVPVLVSESHGHTESVTVTSTTAYYPSPTLYPSATTYP